MQRPTGSGSGSLERLFHFLLGESGRQSLSQLLGLLLIGHLEGVEELCNTQSAG